MVEGGIGHSSYALTFWWPVQRLTTVGGGELEGNNQAVKLQMASANKTKQNEKKTKKQACFLSTGAERHGDILFFFFLVTRS